MASDKELKTITEQKVKTKLGVMICVSRIVCPV